jgi:hypothetical protein
MTMKRVIRVFRWVGVSLCLATWAIAQTSVTLTGPPPGNVYDNIYMSPYYATVGGVTNTPVVCDDFGDDSTLRTWQAAITPFSTISGTNTSWGLPGGTLTSTLAQYNEVAWFSVALINMPITGQPTNALTPQVIDSFALWAIFDPVGVASYLQSFSGNSLNNAALCTDIFGSADCSGAAKGSAYASVTGPPAGGYNLEIISPNTASGSLCQAGMEKCVAQEFVAVSVPEGGAALAYLLLAVLCCFGAIRMRSHRPIGGISAA